MWAEKPVIMKGTASKIHLPYALHASSLVVRILEGDYMNQVMPFDNFSKQTYVSRLIRIMTASRMKVREAVLYQTESIF